MTRHRPLLALALLSVSAGSVAKTEPGPPHAKPGRYVPPRLIDFSPLHDVLIQNDDGTRQPMDVPYYRSKVIGPGVWQIESDGDFHYLIEGDKEALAIDSGYGAGNLRTYLQTLTRKPVRWIASTHFHFDHTANNAYFDRAFMSQGTAEKATIPYPSFKGVSFPRDYPTTIVTDGYTFHLGNRNVVVLVIGNHTNGGTAYLDAKSRILFSGDEIMGRNEPVNVSVAQFAANMRKLQAHRSQFDRMAGGPGIFDATDADKYLAAAEAVLAGQEGTLPQPRGPGMGPPPAPTDTSGKTVYLRRMVRAPDRPANMGAPNPNARVMVSGDRQITYDARRVRD